MRQTAGHWFGRLPFLLVDTLAGGRLCYSFRNNSGSLAALAAIRRASTWPPISAPAHPRNRRRRAAAQRRPSRRSRRPIPRSTTAEGSHCGTMSAIRRQATAQSRRFVDAIGCSMVVWRCSFASKTVTCGPGYLFFISCAAFSAASYVSNPDLSCRSTAT
jgi:hypothetical protein